MTERMQRVSISYQNLNSRGHGYRVVGKIVHEGMAYWPEACPIAENVAGELHPLAGPAMRVWQRHCAIECDLPVGTIVVRWECPVRQYRAQRGELAAYRVSEDGELIPADDIRCTRNGDGDYIVVEGKKVRLR